MRINVAVKSKLYSRTEIIVIAKRYESFFSLKLARHCFWHNFSNCTFQPHLNENLSSCIIVITTNSKIVSLFFAIQWFYFSILEFVLKQVSLEGQLYFGQWSCLNQGTMDTLPFLLIKMTVR